MPAASPPQVSTPCILRVAVPSPLRQSFHYLLPEGWQAGQDPAPQPGVRVLVPFGRRTLVGIILTIDSEADVETARLRHAREILDSKPLLPATMLELYTWAAAYYQHPVGEVLSALLPPPLRDGKEAVIKRRNSDQHEYSVTAQPQPDWSGQLNNEQQQACAAINEAFGTFECFLLDGITGSGKTEVYLQTIKQVLAHGRQALVLVPEISLTPQTITRFRQRFDKHIVVMHSGLTPRQRLNAWLEAGSGAADIIIGTRSAVFTPLARPGLIIIDEEHDSSFKQQDGFRYSARDFAIMRASKEALCVVLGSATPSLETLHNARSSRYRHLHLRARAGSATTPSFRLLDIKSQSLQEGFSPQLIELIAEHLKKRAQVLVFINRRGFAPVLQCNDCGWIAECRLCDARLTLHKTPPQLRCHHCDSRQAINRHCPDCQSRDLFALGLGTERSEVLLQELFPDTRVIRIDRDSTRRKNELDTLLAEVHSGEPCILVGTQMLAKGHHFPAVTLVAVLDADSGLFSADFRGQEHMAQLLIQVAGRAGRAEQAGEVVIQTRHSTHYSLQTLIHEGYHSFAKLLLNEREIAGMPPFCRLALLRADSIDQQLPEQFLDKTRTLAAHLLANLPVAAQQDIQIIGPLPAPMEKRAGRYRAQLIIQSRERAGLHYLLNTLCEALDKEKTSRRIRWSVDVDPQSMI